MAQKIVITNVGIQEILNAEQSGTAPVKISQVGFGSSQYTAAVTQTAMKGRFKLLTTIAGGAVDSKTIHLTIRDDSSDAYTLYEVGLYTESGVLFAVYSQSTPILQKAAASSALLALDIAVTDFTATSVTFGDTTYVNPPATETVQGVVELATSAEVIAGTDATRAVTPAGLVARTATTSRTGVVELATSAETKTGTDATRAVTPAGLKANYALKNSSDAFTGGTITASTKFVGTLEGAATSATNDGAGNEISSTYAKLAGANAFSGTNSFSGRTVLNGRTDFTSLYITDGTNTHSAVRKELESSSYGSNVSFGAGGSTFVTSGEASAYITEDNGFSSASEHVQLLADSQIYFRPDLNGGWDASKGAIMSSGVFRPITNAGMSLGNATYKFNNVYANGFVGDLTGTASQATADATGATISTTYVHLAGAETITGGKTFTEDFIRQFKTFTKGTTPSSSQYISIRFTDANAAALGGIQSYVDPEGATRVRLYTYKNDPNSTDFKALGVINPLTGSAYAYCPSTPAGSNSNQIATADFVVGLDSNAVHKTGDESITGVKTFENYLVIDRTDQTPTAGEMVGAINFRYKNPDGTVITIYPFQYIAGTSTANNSLAIGSSNGATIIGAGEGGKRIYATNPNAANSEGLFLAADTNILTYAGVSNDGSGGTLVSTQSASGATFSVPLNAPTPAAGDSSTQVATTAFVSNGFLKLSGGAMTGTITSGLETTLSASRTSGNVWAAKAERSDKSNAIAFGIGSAGVNRGIYDSATSKWIVYCDGANAASQLNVTDTSDDSATHLASTGWTKDVLEGYLPLSGGTMTGSIKRSGIAIANTGATTYTEILGGSTVSNGSWLAFYGASNSTYGGCIRGRVNDGTDNRYITLKPDGTFQWGTEEVERVVASGTNYIKYASGLLICWGTATASATITFPVAFANTNYAISLGYAQGETSTWNSYYETSTKKTTGFKLNVQTSVSSQCGWTAIGYWK